MTILMPPPPHPDISPRLYPVNAPQRVPMFWSFISAPSPCGPFPYTFICLLLVEVTVVFLMTGRNFMLSGQALVPSSSFSIFVPLLLVSVLIQTEILSADTGGRRAGEI